MIYSKSKYINNRHKNKNKKDKRINIVREYCYYLREEMRIKDKSYLSFLLFFFLQWKHKSNAIYISIHFM